MDFPQATPSQEILARNLGALLAVDPQLAERLSWPVASDHLQCDRDGRWRYRIHRTWHVLEPEPALAKKSLEIALFDSVAGSSGPRRVLLLGSGVGEFLASLLALEGLREIRVWERDPWILRMALSRIDLSQAIASRRVRLLLTTDLIGVRSAGVAVIEHPFLGRIYQRERAHLDDPSQAGAVALAAGGLFVDQLSGELSARGFAPWTVDLSVLSPEEVSRSLRSLAPRFLMAVNYTTGLAKLAHELDLDVIVWEVDPASTPPRSEGVPTDRVRIFTHARDNQAAWRQAGFTHVSYLPLAADPNVRSGSLDTENEFALSFVGQSLVGNAEALAKRFLAVHTAWRGVESESNEDQALSLLQRLVKGQQESFDRFLIPALLDEHAPGFRAAAMDTLGLEDPAVLAGEWASSEKRLSALEDLAPLHPDIWGDEGWTQLASSDSTYHGPAGHGAELTSIYDRSLINLDVGRLYQANIVTMRVFDALSVGSLVLTEENQALADLFDIQSDLATYKSRAELIAQAKHFSAHPDQARELAARGMEAVHKRHTIAHRMDVMLQAIEKPQGNTV